MVQVRSLTESVLWIFDCHPAGEDHHVHVSQYLIEVDGRYVLVDAGGDFEGGLRDAIVECTDGQGIDALLLTHSILPHMRSANALKEEWEDLTFVSAASTPVIVGLEGAEPKVLNSTQAVLGRDYRFLDPLLTDVVNSNWIYDAEEGILFTAEGVGHYHSSELCVKTSADLPDGVPSDYIHKFHRDKLPFLAYIDPAKLRRGFESVFSTFDVEWLAPIHGTPIARNDVDTYVERVVQSAERFADVNPSEVPIHKPDPP